MGDTTSASEHEERKLKLEEREADRADRQLELDNRWVKVWGPALITGILALAGVVITGLITWTENRFSDQEKAIEDNRAAAEMYFDKLGDLENKDKLTDTEKKRLINDLQIISILGHDQRFNTIFITEQKVVYASLLGACPGNC